MNDFALPTVRDWSHQSLKDLAKSSLLVCGVPLGDVIASCRGSLCYLATPYSKVTVRPDGAWCPALSLDCAVRAARWSRTLAVEGVTAVSPIVQAVEMVHADVIDPLLDPLDGEFWERWCAPLLRASDCVIVPQIPGWSESDGIWTEVREALRTSRRVYLLGREGSEREGAV